MSTTNPAPGSPPADDHGGISAPSPETVARGYEADVYDSKTVLSVPLLVVLFFVLAFGTVTVIFGFIAYPKSDGKAHPQAAKRYEAGLNARMRKIDRATKDEDGVKQPRLEPLKLRSGDARAITRPELPEGNSPELHPEDLRPTKDRFPALFGKTGIDKTMALSDADLAKQFPVQQAGTKPANSQHVPTAANAGRGAEESLAVPPALPVPPEAKKEGKKDNNPPAPDPKGGKP